MKNRNPLFHPGRSCLPKNGEAARGCDRRGACTGGFPDRKSQDRPFARRPLCGRSDGEKIMKVDGNAIDYCDRYILAALLIGIGCLAQAGDLGLYVSEDALQIDYSRDIKLMDMEGNKLSAGFYNDVRWLCCRAMDDRCGRDESVPSPPLGILHARFDADKITLGGNCKFNMVWTRSI